MSSQTRYACLINPCSKRKDFSLLTLYEHLCYHLKEKGFTEHFEYKCVPCKAFFTNKVFMVRHKMESGNENHEIERMPEIDLLNPQNDERLRRAVQLLSDDYLRYKFKVSTDELFGGTAPGMIGTPKYGDKGAYSPRTPRALSPFTPGTPRHNQEDNRVKDFSNCFANATPTRPILDRAPFDMHNRDNDLVRRTPNLSNETPLQWQVAAIREAFGFPNVDKSVTALFSNRGFGNNSDNGGNFRPWDGGQGERNFDRGGTGERSFDRGGAGERSFDRGGAGERSFDRGGRDFQNNFDSNSNDNFNRSENRRGIDRGGRGGFRGDRGGRGGFRGGERSFRGRGNFRGGDDDRGRGGRGRGRGFGGFDNREEKRDNERGRSRSRSPVRRAPPAEERRSYSRSRSPSGSPKKQTPSSSLKNSPPPKKTRERSYSGSPKSD